jgi:hypothetical protein
MQPPRELSFCRIPVVVDAIPGRIVSTIVQVFPFPWDNPLTMTRKQHYEAIAQIIGNEMSLGVNLMREETEDWQMHLRSVARQLAAYFSQDRRFDRQRFLELCKAVETRRGQSAG